MRNLAAVLAAIVALGTFGLSDGTYREDLLATLFANYEPSERPASKGVRIDLNVNITMQHFDFKPSDGSFHFVGHLDVSWLDPKLKWRPSDYGNLTSLAVSQKLVWVPDLEVYNNAPDKMFRMHRNGFVAMNYEGAMCWSDTIEINTFCTTAMEDYPWDNHKCNIRLGSWTYDALDVDITNNNTRLNNTLNLENIDRPNMAYRITNFTAMHVSTTYSCCAEPYVTVDYLIDFERNAKYTVIFRSTAICIILLGLLSASESIQLSRRILIAGIAYFTISIHILHFATQIGPICRTTPSIVKFYSCSSIILTFTTIVALLSTTCTWARVRVEIPTRVYQTLNSFGFVLAYANARSVENNLNESESNLRSLISSSKQVIPIKFRAQRVSFLIAILMYALTAGVYRV